MLFLNETSLFYYDLSTKASEPHGSSALIQNWAKTVSRSTSMLKTVTTGSSKSKSSAAGLAAFSASGASRTQSSKATSADIQTSKAKKSLDKHSPLPIFERAAEDLFDDDEEPEREAALSSPRKGQQRLTSQVRFLSFCWHSLKLSQAIVKIEPANDNQVGFFLLVDIFSHCFRRPSSLKPTQIRHS
jgi:hypothetical protein